MSDEAFKILKLIDDAAYEKIALLDRGLLSGNRDTYYDGYYNGVLEAMSKIREVVRDECEDFDDRVNKMDG